MIKLLKATHAECDSAAAERVFSLAFLSKQCSSLEDYVEGTIMLKILFFMA